MEKNLIDWVNRISEKRDTLGGFSICPFAKKAMEEKKIYFTHIGFEIEKYILNFINSTPDDFELIAFFDVAKTLTDDDLLYYIEELQKKRQDLIFLKDHPSNPGFINGVETGNKKYPVILVQPRNKLEEAREKLARTSYYNYWSEDYKNEIWSYGNESNFN